MDELFHECGIAAVCHLDTDDHSDLVPDSDPEQSSRLIPGMLLDMQNRGQLAAGFTTWQPGRSQLIDVSKIQISKLLPACWLYCSLQFPISLDQPQRRIRSSIHPPLINCGWLPAIISKTMPMPITPPTH